MAETSTTTDSTVQIDGLRAAADFIAAHPEFPAPYVTAFSSGQSVDLNYYLHINNRGTLDEQKALAAAIVRAVPGTWDKDPDSDGFRFTTTSGSLTFDVRVQREAVCERIVTGTETVTIPAVEAQPERTEVVETVEWRCQPLLADHEQARA